MNIAFFHYHTKKGGVTTVIQQQIDALKEHNLLVFTGEKNLNALRNVDVVEIKCYGYDEKIKCKSKPKDIANEIYNQMVKKWGRVCDILHVHNPTLGKNKNIVKILKLLQKKGIKLFLQIHDFAEDGRPDSYIKENYIKNAHYGVINSRDYNLLLNSGLKKEGIHKVFNIVRKINTNRITKENLILYPIRAIRRKNIGEVLFLSLFINEKDYIGITLPPNSEQDKTIYLEWKKLAKKLKLRILFDDDLNDNFENLISKSKFIISTSINEGFGFSYLEGWLADKFVTGRILPDICQDFIDNGVNLKHMYDAIFIPLDFFDYNKYFLRLIHLYLLSIKRFGLNVNKRAEINNYIANIHKKKIIDFGLLDEIAQKEIIINIKKSKKKLDTIKRKNNFLLNFENINKLIIKKIKV